MFSNTFSTLLIDVLKIQFPCNLVKIFSLDLEIKLALVSRGRYGFCSDGRTCLGQAKILSRDFVLCCPLTSVEVIVLVSVYELVCWLGWCPPVIWFSCYFLCVCRLVFYLEMSVCELLASLLMLTCVIIKRVNIWYHDYRIWSFMVLLDLIFVNIPLSTSVTCCHVMKWLNIVKWSAKVI